MILIDTDSIDTAAIEKIYGENGSLVETVEKRIKAICPSGNDLTDQLFHDWFFDGDDVSAKNISAFLLNKDNTKWIEAYAKKACTLIWQKESYYDVFLRHQFYAAEAAKEDTPEKRLKAISKVLSKEHIERQMFEVTEGKKKDKKAVYRTLELYDLENASQTGALCSDSKILSSLRLCENSVIKGFNENCETIFNYQSFSRSYRDTVLNAIGVSVCPYCNRQYISAWGTGKKRRNTGDIEHFYYKDRFPFLALSLYNFIPSCQICNSRFKGTKDFYAFPHLNPYLNSFGKDVHFTIKDIRSVIDYNGGAEIDLEIEESATPEHLNSIETFHIKELYQNHADYAKEIIKKQRMFSITKLKEYLSEYRCMFSSKDELRQTVFGNYLKVGEQGKRPLAKLTQDLLGELGEIDPGEKSSQ